MEKWHVDGDLIPVCKNIDSVFDKNGWHDFLFGVFLFGSSAGGTEKKSHDTDMFFVFQEMGQNNLPSPLNNNSKFRDYFSQHKFAENLHLFSQTKGKILELCQMDNELIKNVLADGQIIRGGGRNGELKPVEDFRKRAIRQFDLKALEKEKKDQLMKKNKLLVKPITFYKST